MTRREFNVLLCGAAADWLWLGPLSARAQEAVKAVPPAAAAASAAPAEVGQVATVQGGASVTRAGATAVAALKVSDPIFRNDTLATGAASSLGITFDDETTFSLSANARIVVDEFVYQEPGKGNAALFTVARGTVAFIASEVAKTGDMKIATPTATMGIRGTTGIVEVPAGGAGAAGVPTIKLYPDANGHVGRIEVFNRRGGRLGILTRGASALALRIGAGGRLAAMPVAIPLFEAMRDRGVLQRLFVSHAIGRRMTLQRRRSRGHGPARPNAPHRQRPNNPRQPNQPRRPNGPPQRNRLPGQGGPRPPGGPRQQPRRPAPSGNKKR